MQYTSRLIHRVTLQRLNAVAYTEATGDDIVSWDTIGTYYAHVRSLTGRELVNAKQVVALATHTIRMRVIGPITSADQLIFQGRLFGISSVVRDDERNTFYSIIAYEKVGG